MPASIENYVIPKYLYRYRNVYGPKRRALELGAVEQRYIFCASYKDMNDPMEGLYEADPAVSTSAAWRAIRIRIRQGKGQVGIASFSETNDNELLWAHYALGYQGICIEYDFEKLRDGLSNAESFSRISYSDRQYQLANIGSDNSHIKAMLSTKSVKWQYEREWRLFSPGVGIKDYVQPAVTRVFYGSRLSKAARDQLTPALNHLGIPISEMTVQGYRISFDGSIASSA